VDCDFNQAKQSWCRFTTKLPTGGGGGGGESRLLHLEWAGRPTLSAALRRSSRPKSSACQPVGGNGHLKQPIRQRNNSRPGNDRWKDTSLVGNNSRREAARVLAHCRVCVFLNGNLAVRSTLTVMAVRCTVQLLLRRRAFVLKRGDITWWVVRPRWDKRKHSSATVLNRVLVATDGK